MWNKRRAFVGMALNIVTKYMEATKLYESRVTGQLWRNKEMKIKKSNVWLCNVKNYLKKHEKEREHSRNNTVNFRNQFYSEAVARRCSVKKVFLEISQNSQESTCARVSLFIKLQYRGLQLY